MRTPPDASYAGRFLLRLPAPAWHLPPPPVVSCLPASSCKPAVAVSAPSAAARGAQPVLCASFLPQVGQIRVSTRNSSCKNTVCKSWSFPTGNVVIWATHGFGQPYPCRRAPDTNSLTPPRALTCAGRGRGWRALWWRRGRSTQRRRWRWGQGAEGVGVGGRLKIGTGLGWEFDL